MCIYHVLLASRDWKYSIAYFRFYMNQRLQYILGDYDHVHGTYDDHPQPSVLNHGHRQRDLCRIDPVNGANANAMMLNYQGTSYKTSGCECNICRM